MNWNVYFSEKAAKQVKKLNKRVISILDLLVSDLRNKGAAPGQGWANYGKLKEKKQISGIVI